MGASATMKYHDSWRQFTYFVEWDCDFCHVFWCTEYLYSNPRERPSLVGSLAGAAHLLNDNTGVLREAQ